MENNKLDLDIIVRIKHLNKCLNKDFDERLAEHGLTNQQGRILLYINHFYKENKEIHQSDIEKVFQLSKSSVSEIISRMETNGLIARFSVRSRNVLIPSTNGQAICNDIHESKIKVIKKLFTDFTEEEINNITYYIQRMTENIEKEESYVKEN